MVAMSAQAFATSKTVTVTEAGTLSTLIPASEKNAITSLTVSGTLNGTDIRFIREMAGLDIEGETTDGKLTELNIAGIELTDGGDAYYEDAWSKYYTATSYDVSEDNDLYYCTDLSYAFTGTNLTKVVWPATMWEVGENALAYCSDSRIGHRSDWQRPYSSFQRRPHQAGMYRHVHRGGCQRGQLPLVLFQLRRSRSGRLHHIVRNQRRLALHSTHAP